MEHFADAGIEWRSLRGTSGSPADQKSVQITEHVADLKSFVDKTTAASPSSALGGASVLKYQRRST